jgi:hypothetical protein
MPVFTKEGVRCLFIHIPKAGGTSLESALRRLGWADQLILHEPITQVRHFKTSPQHFHGPLLEEIMRWEMLDGAFTICRHPFERLKSEFYWQQASGTAPSASPSLWLQSVFDTFGRDPYAFDNHLRPQHEFLPAGRSVKVFKLEDAGVEQAVAFADGLSRASPLRRWMLDRFPRRRHSFEKSAAVEAEFSALRGRIEAAYAVDMAFFGY